MAGGGRSVRHGKETEKRQNYPSSALIQFQETHKDYSWLIGFQSLKLSFSLNPERFTANWVVIILRINNIFQPIFMSFVGLEKAHDQVPREIL